jgi:hypothetical protein
LKNTNNKNDENLHEEVTIKNCHLNEAKKIQTEQYTKNIKSVNNLLNENDDLFIILNTIKMFVYLVSFHDYRVR